MTSRLKNLELHGYKTFASKVSFEFPGKITAIVGPNGSGKSNIADAIRWVLGEQSFRLLRGRKTEDMIFIGSDSRPRAGMASATITFDNEDNWLPIDFSEVSVTRRAYRDGQNEYLLNGQKIRLRDIQELLAQSGLAERTYTLIGQGLVDSALSIRPDERRKFFEEAAGIGLYRTRREEALNRLDQTRRNLERVKDILSELEPRLRSLERQARRFIEYKTIQTDLQILLREWYGYHWHKAQNELSHSKQSLHERESVLSDARENYEKFDVQISSLRKELFEIREQLNDWHSQSSDQHKYREQISKELAVLDERQRSTKDQRQNLQSDMLRVEEELIERELTITRLRNDYEQLVKESQDAIQQMHTFQSSLELRRQDREKIEKIVRDYRRELVQSETKSVELKAKRNELQERIATLKLNLEKINLEYAASQKVFDDVKQKYNQLESTEIQNEEERKKIVTKINISSQEIKELEEKNNDFRKDVNKHNSELARLTAQIEILDQAESSLAGMNQGAKTILTASRKGSIPGKYMPLSSFIEVPKKYESAITASLGEYLDAIVLLDQSDPDAAMHLLSLEDKGRAVIMPISRLKSNEKINVQTGDGIFGRANDLISWNENISSAINLLLENTIIVENRKVAQSLLKNLPLNGRVVTMDGEIFNGSGAVIAGKENKSIVISRPRQKKELQLSLDQIQNQLKTLEESSNQNEDLMTKKRAELQKYRIQLQNFDRESQEKLKIVHQSNLAFEQAKQRNEWLKSQIQIVEQQINQSDQLIVNVNSELSEFEKKCEQLRLKVRESSQKLDELPIEEMQADLVHWRTNSAVSERAANESQKRFQEFELLLKQGQQRQQMMKRRLEDLEMATEDLDDQKALLLAKEQEIQIQIEEIQKKIFPSEEKLKFVENSYAVLQEEQSNAHQGVAIAERYASQAQLEFARNKDTLQNLQHRIEEDFGLVEFEYSTNISGPNPLPFDGLVEQLPNRESIDVDLEENILRQRAHLRRIGPINPDANEEFTSVKERFEFMTSQVDDLKKADEDLRQVISELDELMQREFRKTFDAVAIEFKDIFTQLFGGGTAKLILTDEENFYLTGIDIEARLPGRREQGLSLLSGGERSLTAVALIFALLKVSPTPFCVLDEVDAALDEANVGRFCDLLKSLSEKIQFIVITHNRNTVQVADVIYGITMGRDSTSQMISLKLDEVSEEMVK